MEAIDALLRLGGVSINEIGRVVVGIGPGGFTGIRLGIATALALGQALDVPVVGANSLEALALSFAPIAPPDTLVLAATDARRGEVFAAMFGKSGTGLTTFLAAVALRPDVVAERAVTIAGDRLVSAVGTGALAYTDIFERAHVAVPSNPDAHAIHATALVARVDAGAARPARPDYCRLPDAEVARRARAVGA